MKAPAAYALWLSRRIEAGDDMGRVKRQIEAWKAKPPEGLAVRDLDGLLVTLDKANPKKGKPAPPAPLPDGVDAFG